jgi:hypothetical protein
LFTRLPEAGAPGLFALNEGLFIAMNERQMRSRKYFFSKNTNHSVSVGQYKALDVIVGSNCKVLVLA